jgi:hypothetical protein
MQDFVIPHHVVDEANIITCQCYDQETSKFCNLTYHTCHTDTSISQSTPPSLSYLRPTHTINHTLDHQPRSSKSTSILREILKQSTNQHANSSKLTVGAALLLGVSIIVSPFKEGSPAKIIMNTTDILLQERKGKRMTVMSMAWWKASYAWISVHLWTVVVAVVAWWKVSRA